MEKITLESLHDEVQELARITAEGFRGMATKEELKGLATKEELSALRTDMQAGFSLIAEELRPLRRDYEALKDDLAPEVEHLKERVTKVERKLVTL